MLPHAVPFSREGEADADHPEPPQLPGRRCGSRRSGSPRRHDASLGETAARGYHASALRSCPRFPPCHDAALCAEELLHDEGFTEIEFIEPAQRRRVAADVAQWRPRFRHGGSRRISCSWSIDRERRSTVLSRRACRLLRTARQSKTSRRVMDLQGKRVGVNQLNGIPHVLVSVMAAYVGLDAAQGHRLGRQSAMSAGCCFAAGKVDAFLGFPPEPQIAEPAKHRPRRSSTSPLDQPVVATISAAWWPPTADFVRSNPVATKRVLRAILKAADLCAGRPGAGGADGWSIRVSPQLRLRADDAERRALRRCGGNTIPRTRSASISLAPATSQA